MKNKITKTKNTLEAIHSRLDYTEEWISDLEDRVVEIIQDEQRKKTIFKSEGSLRPQGPHQMYRSPEGEEREKMSRELF